MSKGIEGAVQSLRKAANAPDNEYQRVFSAQVKEVNQKYEDKISNIFSEQLWYWFYSVLWWAGGTAILFTAGFSIGWVYRGFKKPQLQD